MHNLIRDQQLPDGAGSDLLVPLLRVSPDLPVVMMTGQHDLELAIEAIQRGAADFVHKPVQAETLQRTVEALLEQRRLARQAMPRSAAATSPPRDLKRVLDHTGGHKARSCEILGISRPALDRKIAKFGLNVQRAGR